MRGAGGFFQKAALLGSRPQTAGQSPIPFMDFLQDEEMNVEYEVASNNTLFFDRYIGSRRHAPRIPKCDPKTGEVIEKKES